MLHETQLDTLWSEYYPRVFGYFFKRVNSYEDCEELAATSMTIFLNKIENGDLKPTAYYGYLWKIARTQLVNHIRSKNSKPAIVSLLDNEDFEISDLEQRISNQYENLILSVFNQANRILSSEEFYLLKLSYQEGKNSTQIAKDLSINAVAVRKRISRIITKLQTNLKPI
jgi:RNA polymerase sigma factor (sigma-70 family)